MPSAASQTKYGSASPRWRISVPMLPLVIATTMTAAKACATSIHVSSGVAPVSGDDADRHERQQDEPRHLFRQVGAQQPGLGLPRQAAAMK